MTKSDNPQGGGEHYAQPQQPQVPGQQAIPAQPVAGSYNQEPQRFAQNPDGSLVQPAPPTMEAAPQYAPAPPPQFDPAGYVPPVAPAPYTEYAPTQQPPLTAPVAGQPVDPSFPPQVQPLIDDYQYPQGQSILPEVPSIAVPPSMAAPADPMMQQPPQQPLSPLPPQTMEQGGYIDPAAVNPVGEQISQRLAQLQNQYDEEMSGETPGLTQNAAPTTETYVNFQPPVEEFAGYPPMQPEQQPPQAYQQPPQNYQDLQQQPMGGYVQPPMAPQQGGYVDPGVMPDAVQQQYMPEEHLSAGAPSIAQEIPEGSGMLKKVMLGGAFVAALAVGGGAAYTYQYTDLFGSRNSSGPAPTIKATDSPIKIIKQKMAGAKESVNKAMHNRLNGGSGSKNSGFGNSADTLARKTMNSARNAGNKITAANMGMLSEGRNIGGGVAAPRRVKTLIVRPDGTILRPAGGNVANNLGTKAKSLQDSPRLNAGSVPKSRDVASRTNNGVRRMKTIGEASTARRLGGKAVNSAKKLASRSQQMQPVVRKTNPVRAVKAVAPKVRPVRTAAPTPRPRGNVGTPFVVQVTSRSSQTSALAAFADMQQKYPSLIGTFAPDIQRADLGTKGVWYRLRVGPVESKSAAVNLCSSLKQAGHPGCFVRRK